MSLKGFHLFFIATSAVLAFGLGAWAVVRFVEIGGPGNAALALLSTIGGIVLVMYGINMRRKLKKLGFTWDIR